MMSESTTRHTTVLLKETIDGLNLKAGSVVFDGTLGGGGHSAYIAEKFGREVKIIAVDLDCEALKRADVRLKKLGADYSLAVSNFRQIDQVLATQGVTQVQGVILDLGLSSDQLDASGRGFSFQKNEPLLMTLSSSTKDVLITAQTIVNNWDEETLADIIYGYADERYAKRIAKKIVEARTTQEILTTGQLVEIIKTAVPAVYRRGKTHFATKTFQAIRMAVNDEVGALNEGLQKSFACLCPTGRLAVISFHSVEDRIIKNYFRSLIKEKKAILINKKPIIATAEEIKINPRARSAKLRIIEKI